MSTLHYKQLLARRELHTYLHYICSHVQCSHAVCGSGIHTRIAVNQEVKKCGHLIFLLCITVCLFLDNGMDWSFIHIVESIRIYFRVVLQQSDDMLKVEYFFSIDYRFKECVCIQFGNVHKFETQCSDWKNTFPFFNTLEKNKASSRHFKTEPHVDGIAELGGSTHVLPRKIFS